MEFDAAVIGSGPAGATAARLLAQAGWSVALIERTGFPRRKVCGEFVSAATLPVLEVCGVSAEFLARSGRPIREIAACSGDVVVQAPMPRAQERCGRALGREVLDVMLRDAAVAAGASLVQPAEVTAVRTQADRRVLTLRCAQSTDEIGVRTVIVACGSWNTRGPFALTAPSRRGDLFAFKSRFHGAQLAPGVMSLLAFPGGYGGMVHSDAGHVTLSCCMRRDALRKVREVHGGRAGEAVFRHLLASSTGVRRVLQEATLVGSILATGPIRPGIRTRHHHGMFFVGNAAGEAHPIIAEGISMAIQSSWLLTQHLLGDGPAAGPNYSRAWKQQFAPRLRAAAVFAWLAMNDHSRTAAAQLIRRFPSILTWGAQLSGKAGIRDVA